MLLNDLYFLMPELVLALGGMFALVAGLFLSNSRAMLVVCSLVLLGAMFALVQQPEVTAAGSLYSGHLSLSLFSQGMKFILLAITIAVMAMSARAMPVHGIGRFEFPVLMIFATLGMFIMMSASSWLTLYMGLELQSLTLYVLAAFARDNSRASEAGAKYFILGALASGFLLFGISLIYGSTGSLLLNATALYPMGLGIGMAFVLAGIAFKLSLVPFHMWTPDVYDGVPMPVTAYFGLAPKIAGLVLLVNLLAGPFATQAMQANIILLSVGLLSLALGSFAGLRQNSLKRLLAYSTIANVGTLVLALAMGTGFGVIAAINYLLIYVLMSALVFAVLLGLYKGLDPVSTIDDLKGLSRSSPMAAWALALAMFALAGIPPLAGFFAKYEVFKAVIGTGNVAIAAIGITLSVVSAAYYLRIIKSMFFDAPVEGEEAVVSDTCIARRAVVVLLLLKIALLVLVPDIGMQFVGMLLAPHN